MPDDTFKHKEDGECPPMCMCKMGPVCAICGGKHQTQMHRPPSVPPAPIATTEIYRPACKNCGGSGKVAGIPCPACEED